MYCTYPVPLHAHTHFLAAVRPALVLHHVGGQALAAALLLAGLRLAQDLRHALLVDRVQTLVGEEQERLGNHRFGAKTHADQHGGGGWGSAAAALTAPASLSDPRLDASGVHTCFLDLMAASSSVSAASYLPCRL